MKYLQSEFEANEAGFTAASGAKQEIAKEEFMTISDTEAQKLAKEKAAKTVSLGNPGDSDTWAVL